METKPTEDPLEKLQNQEASIQERIYKNTDKLMGQLAIAAFRDIHVADTASVLSERTTTDPYATEGNIKARETLITKATLTPLIGKSAVHNSINGPRGSKIEQDKKEALDLTNNRPPQTFMGRVSDTLNARRLRNLEMSKIRTHKTEITHGIGLGGGVKSKTATALLHEKRYNEVKRSYRNGDISAEQYIQNRADIKGERSQVQGRAVRRAVRHERTRALYSQFRADQPLLKRYRQFRINRTTKKLTNLKEQLDGVRQEKERIV